MESKIFKLYEIILVYIAIPLLLVIAISGLLIGFTLMINIFLFTLKG